ncbi:unnamed protein product, partial [Phaeothamnion confervicola]
MSADASRTAGVSALRQEALRAAVEADAARRRKRSPGGPGAGGTRGTRVGRGLGGAYTPPADQRAIIDFDDDGEAVIAGGDDGYGGNDDSDDNNGPLAPREAWEVDRPWRAAAATGGSPPPPPPSAYGAPTP